MTKKLFAVVFLLASLLTFSHAQVATLDNQEQRTDIHFCQTCANSNPATNPAAAVLTTKIVASPSLDGQAREVAVKALAPYANGYWYYDLPVQYVTSQHVVVGFWLYVTAADLKASQAIEFEFQQTSGGVTYNYAFQANFFSGCWKTFDFGTKKWLPSAVCAPTSALKADKWNHIYYSGTRTATSVQIPFIYVNGVKYAINATHPGVKTGKANHFTVAFQLDSKGTMIPYKATLDKWRVQVY
jgi:hypothetical protein